MLSLGPGELTLILILVILFFGGKRLGQLGEGLGRSVTEFKKALRSHTSSSTETEMKSTREKNEQQRQ